MKNQIKSLYDNTLLKYPLYPVKYLYNFYRFRLLPEEYFLKQRFKEVFGFNPDLKNPKSFSEKVQWLKLNDRTPLHTQCADKFKVRQYVKDKIGEQYLVPLVFETKNVTDIAAANLPDYPVAIKVNHDSSGVIIVHDKNAADWFAIQKKLSKHLKENYYYYDKEWPYKNIERRIIVERLLIGEDGGIPFDYKIHCFNGKPNFIQVDIDRHTKHKRNLYNTDWQLLDVLLRHSNGPEVRRPIQLEKMLELAAVLSEPFFYARIDFYSIFNDVYFGEITFHPGGGREVFKPIEYDYKLGSEIKLPIDN